MHARRSLTAVLATALLLVAGCSSSGGEDTATTTTAASAASTTAAPDDGGDDTTTTEADDDGPADGPTKADLEALLPTAADIGDGWEDTTGDDDDSEDADESDAAIDEQCPEINALADDDEEDDSAKAVRSFGDADGAEVEVKLNPEAQEVTDDELAELVDTINGCGSITFDGGDGSTTTFEFEATVDDGYGDQGLRMQALVTLEVPEVGVIDLTIYFLSYRSGTVGVTVTGSDGFDQDAMEAIPFDPALLEDLAGGLEDPVAELVGG